MTRSSMRVQWPPDSRNRERLRNIMNTQPHEMNRTGEGPERHGTAVIVGASLSGLMTGLALSRAGVDVTMLERVDEFPRTGASLG
jgi:NADPH-dependent 2,4-dienoyl-CoA reductase/sulfur reductase-like enzyme